MKLYCLVASLLLLRADDRLNHARAPEFDLPTKRMTLLTDHECRDETVLDPDGTSRGRRYADRFVFSEWVDVDNVVVPGGTGRGREVRHGTTGDLSLRLHLSRHVVHGDGPQYFDLKPRPRHPQADHLLRGVTVLVKRA